MEEKGIFRSAMGGFNKKDVLEYIDRVTADWNEERQQLTQQAEAQRTAADKAKAEAQAAAEAAAEAAAAAAQQYETDIRAAQQTAEGLREELAQAREECRRAQEQITALQAEAAQKEEARSVATAEMMAAEERLHDREQELADRDARLEELREQHSRCRALLGDCDTVQESVTAVARPYIRTVGRQADDTLEAVGQALAALAAQVAQLQSGIDARRQELQQAQAESERQLDDRAAQWLDAARQLSRSQPDDSRFFR